MSDWFEEDGNGSEVDVAAVFDSKVPELLAECISLGALVSCGTTSDGGALGITVTLDGRWKRQYFRDSEEAIAWLEGAVEYLRTAGEAPRASSGRRRRSRRPRDT